MTNERDGKMEEKLAQYRVSAPLVQPDLSATCQKLIDQHTRALRDVVVDINTKKLETQRIEAEIDALVDRREKLTSELAGARAAMVAMNSGQ